MPGRGGSIEIMGSMGTERCVNKTGQTVAHIQDPIDVYMKAAGNYELLTADQEKDLGRQIQAGLAIDESLQLPEDFRGSKRQRAAAEEKLETARGALDHMVMANLRLAARIATRYSWSSLGYDELLHDGVTGLIRAAKKFDPDKQIKFSTYATWWVRAMIGHSLARTGRHIHLPHGMEVNLTAIRKKQREDPDRTLEDICRELKIGHDSVQAALDSTAPLVWLDKPMNEGEPDGTTINDVLSEKPQYQIELEYTTTDIIRNIHEHLIDKYPTEALDMARIIKWRHVDGFSTEEIAGRLQVRPGDVKGLLNRANKYLCELGEDAIAKASEPAEPDPAYSDTSGYTELTEEDEFDLELLDEYQMAEAS